MKGAGEVSVDMCEGAVGAVELSAAAEESVASVAAAMRAEGRVDLLNRTHEQDERYRR